MFVLFRRLFVSDQGPGYASEPALTAKTTQTIARLLSPKSEPNASHDEDAQRTAHTDVEYAPDTARQPYVYNIPPHTRSKTKTDHQQPLPQSPPQAEYTAPSDGDAAKHDDAVADPRFDDNRWDNQFLAPLLPVQVTVSHVFVNFAVLYVVLSARRQQVG
jgi:hypothetical protein